MTAKAALALQPAPRPQPRTSPEDVARLRAATEDLGFGRAVTPVPGAEAAGAPASEIVPAPQASMDPRRAPALKFDLPEGLWDDLRLKAIRRRVTVKYLVLEALEAKGYPVDLSAIPEDGRRIR